jgi:hypothetical protein
MKRSKKMKSTRIKPIFSGILIFGLVIFSTPGAGDAFLRKIDVLFNKISIPFEFIRAGKSFNRIEKVGVQIHNYSKEREQIGDYRAQKIIKNAEAKYAAGQFSTAQRNSEIKRAEEIRNAYYEYARQIRRYGRSAGRYETRRALEPIANIALRSKKAGHAFQKGYEVLNNGKQALQTIRGEIDKALELVGSKSGTAIARLQRIRDKLNRHADNLEIAYEATQAIGIRGRAIENTLGDGGALARALSEEVGDLQNRIRKGEQNVREFGERLKKQAEKTEKRLTRAEERLRKFKEKGFDTEVRRDRFSLAQFRERMKDKKDILERRSQIARLMAARSGLGTDAKADLPALTDTNEDPSSLPKLTDSTEDQTSPFGDKNTRATEDMLARRKDTRAAQVSSQYAADSGVTRKSSRQKLRRQMITTQDQIQEDARIKAQQDAEKKARDRAVATAVDKRKSMIAELKTLQAQGIDVSFDEGMNSKELEKILADARKQAEQLKKEKEEEENEAARTKAEEDKRKDEEKRRAEDQRKKDEKEEKTILARTYKGAGQLKFKGTANWGVAMINPPKAEFDLNTRFELTLWPGSIFYYTINPNGVECNYVNESVDCKPNPAGTGTGTCSKDGSLIFGTSAMSGTYNEKTATIKIKLKENKQIPDGGILVQELAGTILLQRAK